MPLFPQVGHAPQRQARLGEPDLVFGHGLARRLGLRHGERERRARGRVVEPREHLALGDGHAFFDVDFDDLAGDLRRHGRPAPRRDIARRVQHGRLRAGRPLGDLGDLDLDRPLAGRPHPDAGAGAGDQDEHQRTHPIQRPAPGRSGSRSMRNAFKSCFRSVTTVSSLPD